MSHAISHVIIPTVLLIVIATVVLLNRQPKKLDGEAKENWTSFIDSIRPNLDVSETVVEPPKRIFDYSDTFWETECSYGKGFDLYSEDNKYHLHLDDITGGDPSLRDIAERNITAGDPSKCRDATGHAGGKWQLHSIKDKCLVLKRGTDKQYVYHDRPLTLFKYTGKIEPAHALFLERHDLTRNNGRDEFSLKFKPEKFRMKITDALIKKFTLAQ